MAEGEAFAPAQGAVRRPVPAAEDTQVSCQVDRAAIAADVDATYPFQRIRDRSLLAAMSATARYAVAVPQSTGRSALKVVMA
jgi:hypothetical protein